jgi:hypothetical protein
MRRSGMAEEEELRTRLGAREAESFDRLDDAVSELFALHSVDADEILARVHVQSDRISQMPSRPAERQLGALAKANEVRCERAQLKRELAAGRVEFERVISDPPACAQTAMVRDLLLAIHRVGPTRADRALARCQITANKKVAALSRRQRAALIQLLPL